MIRVDHLNKTYDRARMGDHRVLKDISFQLPDKGFVCILGPSGCGKTSLLNAIGGLDRFDNGSLTAGETTVTRYGAAAYENQRNRNFGYIFQNYYLLEEHTVAYNVYLGLHSLQLSHREKLVRIREALKAVDMDRYIRRKVRDLSGGQQQRVAIARALARRPRVIFADEPTGNLDEANTMNICTLLRKASQDSLVIMVTHEERIANFFADRIIRLEQGCLVSDSESWERESMQSGSDKQIYTGDYQEEILQSEQVKLRLLRREDAVPVELTVVATGDRLILKVSDGRAVSLSSLEENPQIIEGKRPAITLEHLDESSDSHMQIFNQPPDAQCRAGKGLPLSLMAKESMLLMRGKGLKQVGMRLFLVLMAVLTLVVIADYFTVSHVDPQDFIISDSHILVIKVEQGPVMSTEKPTGYNTPLSYQASLYVQHLAQSELDFDFMPVFSLQPKYDFALFTQMSDVKQGLPGFSYVQSDRLDPNLLLCGRMPETADEIVLDRLIIDAVLEKSGILQNVISDYTAFLGERLDYGSKGYDPMIVGISDSGERSLYATDSALYGLTVGAVPAITLSELRHRFPGQYEVLKMVDPRSGEISYFDIDDLTDEECIVNAATAGDIWKYKLGNPYGNPPNRKTAVAFMENDSLSAKIIVTDAAMEQMMLRSYNFEIHLWCADKAAVKAFLAEKTQAQQDGLIIVKVSDPYAEKYAEYQAAATKRADGRTIVTASVVALCMAMLYLLCRSQVSSRLGMVAVYRLLGIPGRKLYGIFLMESAVSALTTMVPTVSLTWLGIEIASHIPELESNLELPWYVAAAAGLCIVAYYLMVSVLPLGRLLRQPPAQLAAKYDI